jgi:hypothetical protein
MEPLVARASPRSWLLSERSSGSASIAEVVRANASPGPMQPLASSLSAHTPSSPGVVAAKDSRLTSSDFPRIRRPLADATQDDFVRLARTRTEALVTDASFTPGGIKSGSFAPLTSRNDPAGCAHALRKATPITSEFPRQTPNALNRLAVIARGCIQGDSAKRGPYNDCRVCRCFMVNRRISCVSR